MGKRRELAIVTAAATATLFVGIPTASTIAPDPDTASADGAADLIGSTTPTKIALDHLQAQALAHADARRSLAATDAAPLELVVDATARTEHAGVTHVYVQQRLDGIDVLGATANVAVTDAGDVVHDPQRLVSDTPIDAATLVDDPILSPAAGLAAALGILEAPPTSPIVAIGSERGAERLQLLSGGEVAVEPVRARLVWVPVDKELVLGWEVQLELFRGDHLQIAVATDDGRELRRDDYTINHSLEPIDLDADGSPDTELSRPLRRVPAVGTTGDIPAVAESSFDDGSSYRVFPIPVEAPAFGGQAVVAEPADPVASPFGWHDTDGVDGAESTLTTGNNVDAYLDQDGNNIADAGSRPDGGAGLDFLTAYDAGAEPDESTNPMADVINLFYANNWAHDFFYAHGFDEASGNFQSNNYGRGGAANDPVRAEGLDSYGLSPASNNRNNANFSTPPDGAPGRMQMYGFTLSSPQRSSSFDNGIILHEYAHGWSNRLTGGRNNVACLNNEEQMGEGWSDWAALMATIEVGDDGDDARGIGAWAVGQNSNGRGIRAFPYSTDLGTDPRTYDTIKTSSVPHGLGSTWAAMLWEVTWALIDRHGFDADLINGTGGNNLAMRLVTDGLKLQPCSPGFVDGRDAIIQADRLANDGDNECLIWGAFAKRGLGWSADQGSSTSRSDGTQAFDLPPFCPLEITIEASSTAADVGDTVTFTAAVENRGTETESDVTATATLAAGLVPVGGSVACDSAATADVTPTEVVLDIGSLTSAARIECTFDAVATADATAGSTALTADFESGLAPFTAFHDDGDLDWTTTTDQPVAGTRSAFATNPTVGGDETTDQSLATVDLGVIAPCSTLEFVHRYDTESNYDGGVVELRGDGGTWTDLGDQMLSGGYVQTISTVFTNSAITGRPAFAGDSGGLRTTVIDLGDHTGTNATIRFRYVSDFSVTSTGWWVDDVTIRTADGSSALATVTSATAGEDADSACVSIDTAGDPTPTTTEPDTTTTTEPDTTTTTEPDTTTTTEPDTTTTTEPGTPTTTDPAGGEPTPTTTTPTREPATPPLRSGSVEQDGLEAASRLGRQG